MGIAENINSVIDKIALAARKSGRDPREIKLIAVSKTKPVEILKEAYDARMRNFGENRPQEIVAKYPEFENNDISWHMIGHLQKNKVRHIIDKVCLIHSVDSFELAEEIDKRARNVGKIQDILIQVNVSDEATKSGVSVSGAEELCRRISVLPNVRIKGLMTISVKGFTYEQNREIFTTLSTLAKEIEKADIQNVSMSELSMGMTHDYEAAIEAGATMVRVGTAIFGERDYTNL